MGDAALVEELTAKLAALQAEKEKESEDRNYAQLERDKIDSFWEITKAELEECKASLRVKDREAEELEERHRVEIKVCLLYTSPSPRDATLSRMPSSA